MPGVNEMEGNGDKKINIAALFITAALIVFYYASVIYFTADAPYADDYDVVLGFMNDFHAPGRDKAGLLFSMHNEHRPVFTKFAVLGSYLAAGKVNFTLLALLGNMGLLAVLLFFLKQKQLKNSLMLLPAALILFSYFYWETISEASFSLQNIWVMGFAAAAIYLAAEKKYILSAVLSAAACFTSGSGLAVLITVLIMLAFRREFVKAAVWCVFSAGIFLLYFHDYVSPAPHPPVYFVLSDPAAGIIYFLSFMGSAAAAPAAAAVPAKYAVILSFAAGAAMLAFFLFLTFEKYGEKNPANYYMMVFLLGTGLLAAVTRSGFGFSEFVPPRYIFVSTIMCACLYTALADRGVFRRQGPGIYILAAVLLAYCAGSFFITRGWQEGRKNLLLRSMYMRDKGPATAAENNPGFFYPDRRKAENILEKAEKNGFYRFKAAGPAEEGL